MMLKIRDPNLVPHGSGFVWRCTHCEAVFKHHTVPFVFEKAREHCQSNGVEFTNNGFTENVCANTPGGICEEVDWNGMPSIVERVVNVTKAVISHGRHGFQNTEEELKQLRLSICQSCVYWGGETGGTWFNIACKKCGCSGIKLKWRAEKCPLGLW